MAQRPKRVTCIMIVCICFISTRPRSWHHDHRHIMIIAIGERFFQYPTPSPPPPPAHPGGLPDLTIGVLCSGLLTKTSLTSEHRQRIAANSLIMGWLLCCKPSGWVRGISKKVQQCRIAAPAIKTCLPFLLFSVLFDSKLEYLCFRDRRRDDITQTFFRAKSNQR